MFSCFTLRPLCSAFYSPEGKTMTWWNGILFYLLFFLIITFSQKGKKTLLGFRYIPSLWVGHAIFPTALRLRDESKTANPGRDRRVPSVLVHDKCRVWTSALSPFIMVPVYKGYTSPAGSCKLKYIWQQQYFFSSSPFQGEWKKYCHFGCEVLFPLPGYQQLHAHAHRAPTKERRLGTKLACVKAVLGERRLKHKLGRCMIALYSCQELK